MFCCPKSVKACAIRVTRLNASGVPLDPLTANSRIQSAGFMELAMAPKYEDGKTDLTRWGDKDTGMVMIVDRDFDILLGFDLKLKLCGVPTAVLEMMLGANLLSDQSGITGVILKDDKRFACREPLMLEVWSKNVADRTLNADGTCDNWVHWLLPLTNYWTLDSDLTLNNGTVEVALKGFGSASPGWFPSAPNPTMGFASYVDGWPTGPAPVVANPLVVPDAWTLGDLADIRAGGPLAWKCVANLPSPLDDCGYTPLPVCVEPDGVVQSFVGASGQPDSPPWSVPVPFDVGGILPQFTTVGAVPQAETFQAAVTGFYGLENGCTCPLHTPEVTMEGVVKVTDGNFSTAPVLAHWTRGGTAVGAMFLAASWSGAAWNLVFSVNDWTTPAGTTGPFQQQSLHPVGSSITPVDGDVYRLVVNYDTYSLTTNSALVVELFINDVVVGSVAWGGVDSIGAGLGHLFDTYVPACEPVGRYGSAVNPGVPYTITVTDLGGGVYNVLGDDSNQSGMISDPAGPVNNDGGASGQCQPNGVAAACATDSESNIPTSQTYNDGTSDYTVVIWPPLITAVTDYAASGTGWKVGLTYDLSDEALALNSSSTAGILAGTAYRDTLAGLVALHGSGVPFAVTSPSLGSAAVTCLSNLYPAGPADSALTGFGFLLVPDAFTVAPMSSVTSFDLRCSQRQIAAPVAWPTWSLGG